MANDLATLAGYLDTVLDDSANTTWGDTEKEDLIKWSVARLYPRLSRILDPTATTVTLVTDTYFYALPAGVLNVARADLIDNSTPAVEYGPLAGGTWEIVGDPLMATGKLHISPALIENGWKVRLYGYARFDTTTNLILDDYVPLVLAMARAEAYRRLIGDRARFKQWLARHQTQDSSVNELILLVNEADAEANQLWARHKVFQRPVPGRI